MRPDDRTPPKARSMGDEALVRSLIGSGCPLCSHVATVAPRYLDSLLYQHTTDRAYRDRFVKGGGFCGRHVRAAMEADTAGDGDGVGGAIFLRSQLGARRRALEGAGGFRGAARVKQATRVAWDCPVCENERTLAGSAARRLMEQVATDATWRTWVVEAPWCLAHVGDMLVAASDLGPAVSGPFRERCLSRMRHIETRLEALAHDSSHDRRERLTPEVRASLREAADLLAGDG